MVGFSVHMEANTTIDISSYHYFQIFISELTRLFGLNRLRVLDGLEPEESFTNKTIPLENCSAVKLKEIYSQGGASLTDTKGVFCAQISWHKNQGKDAHTFVKNMGYMQNKIIFIASAKAMMDKAFHRYFIHLCDWVTTTYSINYLCTYDLECDKLGYNTKLDIGAGLKNFYWLNIFGPPFIRILGKEKLSSSPVFEVRNVDKNHIRLLATPSFDMFKGLMRTELRSSVREHLGEAFFTKERPERPKVAKEGCILAIFGMMLRDHREFNDTSWHAENRPEFDFKEILKL